MNEQNDGTYRNKPDFMAYNVQPSRDGKGHWNRVGVGWKHKDGRGHDIQLDSIPINGRVTLRELRQERIQNYEEQRQALEQVHTGHGRTR